MFKFCALLIFGTALALPTFPEQSERQIDGKIVGGYPTSINEFPHQVSLQYKGAHSCGASILNKNTILTAAHCAYDSDHTSFSIRVGSTYHNSGGQLIKVNEVIMHPLYDDESTDYDVCIMKISKALNFDDTIQPIDLANAEAATGSLATVSGWGDLNNNGDSPLILQAVQVPIITRAQCNAKYGNGVITNRMICAGFNDGGKDSCQGDSGGPLIFNGVQIGVVSWGYDCADGRYPGVYTNIADSGIKDFIQKHS